MKKEYVWKANRSLKIIFCLVQDLEFENSVCLTFIHFFPPSGYLLGLCVSDLVVSLQTSLFWYSLKIPKWLIPPGFDFSLKSQTFVLVCGIFCFSSIFVLMISFLSFFPHLLNSNSSFYLYSVIANKKNAIKMFSWPHCKFWASDVGYNGTSV